MPVLHVEPLPPGAATTARVKERSVASLKIILRVWIEVVVIDGNESIVEGEWHRRSLRLERRGRWGRKLTETTQLFIRRKDDTTTKTLFVFVSSIFRFETA